MPRYQVVPQDIINALAPALSTNQNTGRIIAEELCRTDAGGDILQKMAAGEDLTARDRAQLPPLLPGYNWDAIALIVRDTFEAQNNPQ